jgi:hypothetical protein
MNDTDQRKILIQQLKDAAAELDLARQHFLVAAEHLEDNLIPRFGAHVLAANGHLSKAEKLRDAISETHAAHSVPRAD